MFLELYDNAIRRASKIRTAMKKMFEEKGVKRIKKTAAAMIIEDLKENKLPNLSGEISHKYKEGRHNQKKRVPKESGDITKRNGYQADVQFHTPQNTDTSEFDEFCFCISKFINEGIADENAFDDAMLKFFGRVSKLSQPKVTVTDLHIQHLNLLLLQVPEGDNAQVTSWINRLQSWIQSSSIPYISFGINENAGNYD